jgi:putative membrane-bound dehydrogenase-like protein
MRSFTFLRAFSLLVCITYLIPRGSAVAEDFSLHRFERIPLTDTYYSEGAGAGDIDGDQIIDAVYGPYWFKGPKFDQGFEIFKPEPQPTEGYANHFFSWVHDFNRDGHNDVFAVGFPGTPAYVYENPGKHDAAKHWTKHQVFDWVSNESPQFIDLVGDKNPELVCTRDGFFGFAVFNPEKPFDAWTFHAVSEQITDRKFGHGLGVGDVDGDGRADIIHSGGWFEQPAKAPLAGRWQARSAKFTDAYGGADMFAYDVDGDGDHDVITSLAAHDFGLAWYENQTMDPSDPKFEKHLIVGNHASQNRYGIVFSEPHAVALVDMDGDGLKDIVTGKTYYSHHQGSPMWDAGAVVYWFKLVREKEDVDFVPHLINDQTGIGRGLTVTDINGDKLPDLVVGGMKGASVLLHRSEAVDEKQWNEAQPKRVAVPAPREVVQVQKASARRGPRAPIDPKNQRVDGAVEGESLTGKTTGGTASAQGMQGFAADRWSNQQQLWWTGAKPGDRLTLPLPKKERCDRIEIVLSCARDYAIVQLYLDQTPLGEPIDCFNAEVVTTGVLSFAMDKWTAGDHTLTIEVVGANPNAAKAYMAGVDYIRLVGPDDKFAIPGDGLKPVSLDGSELNLDFESGSLVNWTAEGDAFRDQPIKGDTVSARRNDMFSDHVGEFWIGGYEKHGDVPKGVLTSAPFKVTAPFASFRVGGGSSADTRVELLKEGESKPFFQASGRDNEAMTTVVVDLAKMQGQTMTIRLVDESSAGWGHLNFDHFRFHLKKPAELSAIAAPLVADEYPHGGMDAEAAAAAMKVPDGFTVTVSAAEPEVKQPIAMTIDERGRVWVAEAYEYPIRAKEGAGRDRILIFEDVDGDGKFDKRSVFAEGLNLVSGLEVGYGGVWVGAAPYLLFIADADGDDVPDSKPQVLLDGWGLQDTHETLNAFNWGPDGWLYGCHGVFTHSRVGKPGTPDDSRIAINAGVWRYHPLRHKFEVFAHGTSNPWGVDFNDHGQAFVTACVIPHLFHIIQGARYQRQAGQHFNPHTYKDIVTIADHLHYLGANPHGGNGRSDEAGGGHAHAGAMIYLADTWPKTYRNAIFMNNIHGQRLNVDVLKAKGSGYVGSHAPDFLLTGDQASQILNLRTGPDGNAYMIDWYDMQACHTGDVAKHDRSNGRVYKICYGELQGVTLDLKAMSDLELAELVLNANDFYVRQARNLLAYRASSRAIDPTAQKRLVSIARTHEDDTRRLRALWALHVAGGVPTALHDELMLKDASEYVRGWAVQLAMEPPQNGAQDIATKYAKRFTRMAREDQSAVVRLYLASAAQRLVPEVRWELIEALAQHASDANDHNLPLMIWYAAEPLSDLDPKRALALALTVGDNMPLLREFMLRKIGSGDLNASLVLLIDGLREAKTDALRLVFLDAMKSSLKGQRQVTPPPSWSEVYRGLEQVESPQVQQAATALGVIFGDSKAFASLRKELASPTSPIEQRRASLTSLVQAKDAELPAVLQTLLKEPGLRVEALRGLAQYEHAGTAKAIIEIYSSMNAEEKATAMATLCARESYATKMLIAIKDKRIDKADLSADLARQLTYLESNEIDQLVSTVWGQVRQTAADKAEQIAAYTKMLASKPSQAPDASLGRAVFAKTCQRCHVLYGVGQKLGPDLTGSNRSNLEYLLTNIVDPSAVMASEYQQTLILTDSGQVITGILRSEDERTVTIQTADTSVVIPKDEIESRKPSDKSMMPDDQLKQFSEHEVRSLVAYLVGKEQVPILATQENSSLIFNGTDLSGWTGTEGLWSVENGELVGRTNGLSKNEWIVSDYLMADFVLSVDVKLVGNRGNSGIQFRSRADKGEVSGYQADIGEGWWGKLYEEHGRGLLWDKSGEAAVKSGEWNRYEIEATGHRIRTRINGVECVSLDDPAGEVRGLLAVQLHSGGPTEIRIKNIEFKVVDP